MARKRFYIGSPIGKHPNFHYMTSLIDTLTALSQRDSYPNCDFVVGSSDLAYARNRLAAGFLASDCTDMLWIDADIAWRAEDAVKLLEMDVDFVSGAYRRRGTEKFAVKPLPNEPEDLGSGLRAVAGVGFGFVKTSRRVFEAIMQARPQLKRCDDEAKAVDDGLDLWKFFSFTGGGCGEDFVFCNWWRWAGGTVWLDETIPLSHYGDHDYRYDGKGA